MGASETHRETHRAVEAVFRIERARLIGGLARMVRDVGRAEELAQDALVAALAEWPRTGVPRNPGAWLMAAGKRRAIDGFRHERMRAAKHAEVARELDAADPGHAEAIEAALDDDIGDELLALIFVACHPVLRPEARACRCPAEADRACRAGFGAMVWVSPRRSAGGARR